MKNEDDQCFKWAVTRALNPVDKNAERIDKTLRKQAERLEWDVMEFPVCLQDIGKFEKSNDLSVNVFGYKKGYVYPLMVSSKQRERVVDLLLISDDEKQHYCLIKSLSRLLASQVSKAKCKRYFCRRGLNSYTREDKLEHHQEYCNNHEAVRIVLPEPGTMLGFKNYNRSVRHPFVVYADFESFIKPIDTCQPDPCKSCHTLTNTNIMSHHRSVTTSNALMAKFTARSLLCIQLTAKMMTLHRNLLICLKKISSKFMKNILGSRRR